jgi:cyclopropane-fatty-acyl-phospholipid synthase
MTMTNRGASAAAIQSHYDLGNTFFEQWLDKEMMYSSAIFAEGEGQEALDEAQRRKLDAMAQWAGVRPGHRVLDIGCGWGGLLRRLVARHGVSHATGLSLSAAQNEWIHRAPDPRIDARVESWTEHVPSEPYDAIVSIEAIEAFAKPGLTRAERVDIYRLLFERCHNWLVPGGRIALQVIAYGNSGSEELAPFISKEIFPESDLPSLDELVEAADRRFEVRELVNDREGYVRTLRAWMFRLRASREAVAAVVGEASVCRFESYLRLCCYIFASGNCNLFRIAMRRVDHPRLPALPAAKLQSTHPTESSHDSI